MPIRVAINGFGRIGRLVFRAIAERGFLGNELDVVALVDVTSDADQFAYLLQHDSVHGKFPGKVSVEGQDILFIDGSRIRCIPAAADPSLLPWQALGVDLVIEASSLFISADVAAGHLKAGAGKVIISAPAKGADKTIITGINESEYDPLRHHVLSASSCTVNCLAMPIRVLSDAGIGIESAVVTALNSHTGSQNVTDAFSRRDRRAGRAAAANIIPTPGSAVTISHDIFPELKGRISGTSIRVPTQDVSLLELVVRTERDSSLAEISQLLEKASNTYLNTYLGYTRDELVSSDLFHDSHSAVYDESATNQGNVSGEKRMFRLVFWYDNEWGYSNRIVDLTRIIARSHHIPRFDWAAFEALA